ncbi:MAG: MBL fold metallo-hydrolase [Actinomycetia bacterium]|nr:MBL fold metallo-hydrolase [Actinomycetes bacterium]
MIFTQYYLDCLSHASYLIGDETTGRAVVVDPRRDVSEYVADAQKAGLTIDLALETHFHADFLSGHLELAEATGAAIGFGAAAKPQFQARLFEDGEKYRLGEIVLEVRHTPGHTPESISIVVWENANDETPYGVLTGDTLFIGDVGRPDLLVAAGVSMEDLASQLYDSLHDKIMTLPGDTRVYPAHGAGSACGKNLSTETWSTLANQLETNYALNIEDRAEFVATVTEGQPPAPGYFAYDAGRNQEDRPTLDESAPPALDLARVDEVVVAGAVLLDARDPAEFAQGHLLGAINVGLDGRYAEYAGSVVTPHQEIVLVTDEGFEQEAKIRLGRIGYDNVIGFVADHAQVIAEHPDRSEVASRLTSAQLDERRNEVPDLQLVDVRGPGEVALGGLDGAENIPVPALLSGYEQLDPRRPTVVFCAGGYRSSIAASLLRQKGFGDVSDLIGGYQAWAALHPAG